MAQEWYSGERAHLPPLWFRILNAVSLAKRVCSWFSPCSECFSLGSPVPSTKINIANSNLIWKQWTKSPSVRSTTVISNLFTYVLLLNHIMYEMPVCFCSPSVMMLSTLQFTSLTVVGPSIEFTFRVKSFEL